MFFISVQDSVVSFTAVFGGRLWEFQGLKSFRAVWSLRRRLTFTNTLKAIANPPINAKKYSCYGLKKIHTRNLITKKNSCGSKIPLPPHNFSNGPSLMNQKIYVHDGWVFVCYQYRGILHCNALPAFSLRDASCNVIDIEITCRTFGSVIVALFPICTFARGKGSLETMIYLTVSDSRHGFRSTLKLS